MGAHELELAISFNACQEIFVPSSRQMAVEGVKDLGFSNRVSDQIGIVVQELLENAVKYSSTPDSLVKAKLVISADRREVRVSVSNQATPEQLVLLRDRLDEVLSCDPDSLLVATMKRIAANPESRDSQLGLIRIRYDAGCRLNLSQSCDVVTLNVVCTAEGNPNE